MRESFKSGLFSQSTHNLDVLVSVGWLAFGPLGYKHGQGGPYIRAHPAPFSDGDAGEPLGPGFLQSSWTVGCL